MAISFKSLIGVLSVILFSSCASTGKDRVPNQVTGHVGRSAHAESVEATDNRARDSFVRNQRPETKVNSLNYTCSNTKFTYTFNIQPVMSEAQPAIYKLKAAFDSHELDGSAAVIQYLDFPKENVYNFKTPEEALRYVTQNPILIPTPITSDILILNLGNSTLFKIKKDTRVLESYKCLPFPTSN